MVASTDFICLWDSSIFWQFSSYLDFRWKMLSEYAPLSFSVLLSTGRLYRLAMCIPERSAIVGYMLNLSFATKKTS